MLKPGDIAPDIDAIASDGKRFRLAEQSTRLCTVIYFFPKAFTPGCTKISTAYGVLWPLIGRTRRVTYIVNRLRTIEAVFQHEVQIVKHRDEVLLHVDRMFRSRQRA